jgi:cell division protease FtsH
MSSTSRSFLNYSERTAEQIDADVREIIGHQYYRVKALLNDRRADLESIVAELIKKETLERPELERILNASKQRQAEDKVRA